MKAHPKTVWSLLPSEVKSSIEKDTGMPYGIYRFKYWNALATALILLFIAGILLYTASGALPLVGIAVMVMLAGIFIVSLMIPDQRVRQAFYYRLETDEGLAEAIIRSNLKNWENPPELVTDTCYHYLREIGKWVAEVEQWQLPETSIEELKEFRMLKLKLAHSNLKRCGLVIHDPEWYLTKHLVGG